MNEETQGIAWSFLMTQRHHRMVEQTAVLFVKWQYFPIYLLQQKIKNTIGTFSIKKERGWVACLELKHRKQPSLDS